MDEKEIQKLIEEDIDGSKLVEAATAYFSGDGVEQDLKKAYELYSKAGEKGNFYAYYDMAYMNYYGHGREKNLDLAIELFIKSSDLGDPEGAFHAGELLLHEKGDAEKARDYLKLASERGSLGGKFEYGIFLFEQGEEGGIEEIIEAAKLGNGYAQLFLGDAYLKGEILEKDEGRGIDYLKQAAELRVKRACLMLADIYREGTIVPKDEEAAKRYEEMADEPFED